MQRLIRMNSLMRLDPRFHYLLRRMDLDQSPA
jgi:hypothetical protein